MSGSDQGTVISKNQWPHEQLTHLAVHTPVQAHRQADGAPTEFPTPAAHSFPQHNSAPYPNYPQELTHQNGYSSAEAERQGVNTSPPIVVTSAFGTISPTAFNNNNTTKLHDNEIVEQSENNCQTPIKNELNGNNETLNNNGWEPVQNEDSHSENNDLHSKTPNGHHQILSPVPLQSSRLSWLAESKPCVEILQPLPLKPEINLNESSVDGNGEQKINGDYSQSTSNENSNGAERRTTLNEEETARLLLTLSQNFVNQPNNESNQMEIMVTSANSDPMVSPSYSTTPNGSRGNNSAQRSRTFFRPPGHRGSSTGPATDGNGLICEICGFGCSSRFHYNSHMNTHGCHQCSICNYRSRTEGRLKKHMQDSHTAEQRREFADSQIDSSSTSANEITNMDPPIDVNSLSNQNQSQRLPGTLEQIRALADNSIGFGNDQPNGSGLSNGNADPSQVVKRSGGKPKKYSCKQCGEVTTTKEEQWRHNKTHIPTEKQLACTECDFVTEYKHHLQYHLRNHIGSKPFKCSKCEYTCVNKSMLNSHMKSHTPVYQFRCQDCTYQTKYCHSLKMHTFKYGHRRVQGQVYTVGDENGESLDDCMEGLETDSMKNYDIPDDDLDAIERHKRIERERMQAETNQFQAREAENGNASAQLALINQQSVSTPRLSSLLLQPIATNSAANNQLQQFLLQQQRIGQVQQMIHNANAYHIPRQKCDLCEFSTGSQDELLKHKISHYIPNQQQQAQLNALHLYNQQLSHNSLSIQQPSNFLDLATHLRNHSLQQQTLQNHQIAISKANDLSGNKQGRNQETPDPSGATNTTTASTPRVAGETFVEEHEHMSGSSELHEEAGETSSSPSDSHKSMDVASSGTSPHSSSSAPHTGAKRRKARKLDEISQRLQDKCSPDNTDDRMSPNDKKNDSSLAQPIPSMTPLNGLPNGASNPHQLTSIIAQFSANIQGRPNSAMPYTCQHCMIAFNDQALYQIHLGYHGYDSPFKCNRCGHNSNSSLSFNLHLYQEKH